MRSRKLSSKCQRPRVTAFVASAVVPKPSAAAARGSAPNVLSVIPFAIANGIQFAKIKPVTFDGLDQRGMVATYNINADECICSVPATAAIRTYPGCRATLDVPPSTWLQLPWFAQIALLILNEVKQGSASKLADYIKVLPQQVNVPVLWSPEELQQLQCRYFIEQVQQQQEEWTQLAHQLQPYLSAAHISTAQFLWALSVARSRAFAAPYTPIPLSVTLKMALAAQVVAAVSYIAAGAAGAAGVEVLGLSAAAGVWYWLTQQSQRQQQHALCPLLDMFNHSGKDQSECELDVWYNSFRLVASRSWPAGQQVFINYGSGSNDVLLQLYGFVEADNSQDRYLVRCLPEAAARLGMQAANTSALAEVVFTRQGIPAWAAAGIENLHTQQASNGTGNCHPAIVHFSRLSQQARSVCAAAVENEAQQLGVELAADQRLLQMVEHLPNMQQDLSKLQSKVQQQIAQLKELQQQLGDVQQQPQDPRRPEKQDGCHQDAHGEHHSSDGSSEQSLITAGTSETDAIGVAQQALESVQQLASTIAQKSTDLQQLQSDQSDLHQLVVDWQQQILACNEVAVRYRVEKRRLLDDLLGTLM